MKKMAVLIALMAVMLVPQLSYAEFVRVKGLVWDSELSGNVKLGQSTLLGTELDLKNDLGINQNASIPQLELKLKVPLMGKVMLSYGAGSYDGTRVISRNINFGGKTFNASDTLKTSIDVTTASAMWEWVFLPETLTRAFPSLTSGEFGLLMGLQYLGLDTSLRAAATGVNTSEKTNIPVPVIGTFIQVGFMKKFQAELAFTAFNIGSLKAGPTTIGANYSNISFDVKMDVYKNIPVGLGYKTTNLNADVKNGQAFSADFGLKGLYIFTNFSF